MTTNTNAAAIHTNNTEVIMSDADIAYDAACTEAAFGEDYSLDADDVVIDAETDVAWLVSYIYSPVVRHDTAIHAY